MTTQRKTTGIRIPMHLDKKITEYAEYKGVSKNNLIIDAIWDYLDSKQKKEEKQ